MKLLRGHHLAYCSNIHRGETWAETFQALNEYTLAVKERVRPGGPYGIGLRLSDLASRELSDPPVLLEFRRWLDRHHCYVFTLNGFPYGRFHGGQVKEAVYIPDWTFPARLDYTKRLFDLLSQLVPAGVEGSVSTLPGSFKEFIKSPDQGKTIRANIFHCVEHIARVSQQTSRTLHLGLEPEPLCWLENSLETVQFFDRLRAEYHHDPRIDEYLGVNYDTCHFAVEYEDPAQALARLRSHHVKISKFHLSSALKVRPSGEVCAALKGFAEDTYLHQVIARQPDGALARHRDLGDALRAQAEARNEVSGEEWRIHFHIPLHSPETELFGNTSDHLLGVLDLLGREPGLCSHLEMETYTWEVLPDPFKSRHVVDQLAQEYVWCLERLHERGLA